MIANSKEKKKAKYQQARKIDTQLPSAINVEDHVKARQFEIKALFKAIDNSKTASSSRAFQTLPRHLRRRAASHNPKRVPFRLREKALAEIKGDISKFRRKRRKLLRTRMKKQQSSASRTVNLQKRQLNKSWLETHIWHAKRMKMVNIWGHRLAKHPTEKSFRPSVRASRQGCIVHDASYTAIIQIDGSQESILSLLDSVLDKAGESASSKRYIFGTREMHSYIYRSNSYPTEIISPISLIWHPADGVRDNRSIWLRCHPSAFKAVYESLNEAKIAFSGDDLTISDLRGQVNTFEMYGPQSSQVLAGAFRLAKANGKAQRIAWQKIGKLTTPAHLPTGFVGGFNIDDPRLNFPPRNTKADKDRPVANLTLSTTLAQSGIFSKAEREKVSKPRYKKAEIDSRRSKAQPGKPLAATPNDDVIPILVIQKKLEGGLRDSLDGYTLIVPAGWGMQIWPSLIHTDSRVGGIEQVEQFSVQVGASHFPESGCPTSLANWEECQKRVEDVEERVSRKPKGKRPHYHSSLPLLPFVQKPYQDEKKVDVQSEVKDGQLPTQPSEQAMDVHEDQVNTKQWFITDELIRMVQNEIQENQKDVQDALKSVLTSLKCKDDVILEDALVQATLVPIKRGYVGVCGYVYDKDNDETCGRIATSTFAMNEGKAVAIANMQAAVYFKLYSQKKHLERIVVVQDNDDETKREYRLHCRK